MQTPHADPAPWSDKRRLAELSTRRATAFALRPEAAMRARIAARLGILDLPGLRLDGRLVPVGDEDWELDARLDAMVVQACIVTLAPVTTRIDEPVTRRYLAHMPAIPEEDEVEMPEDDTAEPLPQAVDLGHVMVEALALALPIYPRAEAAELGEAVFTQPGSEAMRDEDARPFADLKALRDSLKPRDE